MFTPRHKPDDSLLGHLTFALKHEGIDLGVLKCLFDGTEPQTIAEIVRRERQARIAAGLNDTVVVSIVVPNVIFDLRRDNLIAL